MELTKTGKERMNRNVRHHQDLVGPKRKQYRYAKLLEESKEMVEDMNQQMLQIEKELIIKKFAHEKAISSLKYKLRYRSWINDEQNFRPECPKQMELDKLTFANNAYRDKKSLLSFSMGKQEINIHNLNNRIHETHSMNGERRLLKMLCKDIDSGVSLTQNEKQIWRLYSLIKWPQYNNIGTRDEEKDKRELKELEYQRDQMFVNAPSKASLWNTLPSTKNLRNEIQAMEARDEEKRKKVLERRKKIELKERKIKNEEKEIKSMRKMIESIRIRKQKALESISHFRENHDSI